MLAEKEWRGQWWLPNVPNSSFAGTLSYSPEKGLELSSKYPIPDFFDKGKKDYYEIILGRTEEAKNITLSGCNFFKNMFLGQFFPRYAIEGMLYDSTEQLLFHRMIIHFNSLTNWSGISGFIYKPTENKTTAIVHKIPRGKKVGKIGSINFMLRTYISHSMNRSHTRDESIKEETVMSLESNHKLHIDEYFEAFFNIKNFLSLAMGRPTYPRTFKGFLGKYAKHHKNKNSVNIFCNLASPPREENAIIPQMMLFPFQTIKTKSEAIIDQWIKTRTKYKLVIDSYIGVTSAEKMYISERYLYYLRMLEGFYTIKYNSPKHTLKKKISVLREDNKTILKKIGINPDTFIDLGKLISTRDYYTHYNPNLSRYLLKGTELHHAVERLKTLLEICIWREIGINNQEIAIAYSRSVSRIQMMGIKKLT